VPRRTGVCSFSRVVPYRAAHLGRTGGRRGKLVGGTQRGLPASRRGWNERPRERLRMAAWSHASCRNFHRTASRRTVRARARASNLEKSSRRVQGQLQLAATRRDTNRHSGTNSIAPSVNRPSPRRATGSWRPKGPSSCAGRRWQSRVFPNDELFIIYADESAGRNEIGDIAARVIRRIPY